MPTIAPTGDETALVFGSDLDNEQPEDTRTEAERDAAIVAAIRHGETHSALALRYGLSHQRISQIWGRDKGALS